MLSHNCALQKVRYYQHGFVSEMHLGTLWKPLRCCLNAIRKSIVHNDHVDNCILNAVGTERKVLYVFICGWNGCIVSVRSQIKSKHAIKRNDLKPFTLRNSYKWWSHVKVLEIWRYLLIDAECTRTDLQTPCVTLCFLQITTSYL